MFFLLNQLKLLLKRTYFETMIYKFEKSIVYEEAETGVAILGSK
jgi:hypothetical protein